jgi:hypothetical protein
MFGQRLANPHILAILGANKQDEVVASGIVGVKEVCDYAQKAEAAREQDELILFAQLCEDVLLEFL